jgi:hypothetical protein
MQFGYLARIVWDMVEQLGIHLWLQICAFSSSQLMGTRATYPSGKPAPHR